MDYTPISDLTGDLSFAAPAKIRILLTPAATGTGGSISPREFEKWANQIRGHTSIKLSDLPRSNAKSSGLSQDSPLYRKGEIHLSWVTSYDPAHAFLAPFNLHKQVLGVIGIANAPDPTSSTSHSASASDTGDPSEVPSSSASSTSSKRSSTTSGSRLHSAPHMLRNQHPGAVIHRVFAFDTGEAVPPDEEEGEAVMDLGSVEHLEDAGDSPNPNGSDLGGTGAGKDDYDPEDEAEREKLKALQDQLMSSEAGANGNGEASGGFGSQAAAGLVVIPALRKDYKDVSFYLRQLVTDFVSSLLDGLDGVVMGLKGSALETPRETLDSGLAPTMQANGTFGSTSPGGTGSGSKGWEFGVAASRASSLFSFGSSSGVNGAAGSRLSGAVGGGQMPDGLSGGAASNNSPKTLRKSTLPPAKTKHQSMGGSGPTGEGRHTKVLADYCLLAGDLWSAISYYDLAMKWMGKERCIAGGQDAVWFASALEGWAVTRALMARLGKSIEERAPPGALRQTKDKEKKEKDKDKDGTADLPYEGLPWESIAEAYTLAIQIYAKCLAPLSVLMAEPARSVTNDTPRDFTHPYIHANACIQYARFLLAVWSCRGWNGECFDQLIYGGVPLALRKRERPTPSTFVIWSHDSGVRRNEIAVSASRALTLSVAALKPRDRVAILSSMTSVFGCIGFVRRETYLLRQLQGALLAWVGQTLLAHGRLRPQAKEMLRIRLGEVAPGMAVVWHSSPQAKSDFEAILMIAVQICETYGIRVDLEPLVDIPDDHVLAKARRTRKQTSYGNPLLAGRASWQETTEIPESDDTAAASIRPGDAQSEFGWIEQQIMLLKDTIGVAETLEDNISMAFFAALLLRDYHTFLAAEEQWRLAQGLLRIASGELISRKTRVAYWGPAEPVSRFEMCQMAAHLKVTEQSYKSLRSSVKSKDESVAGLNNPFFWNPLKSVSRSGAATLVKDCPAEFEVTIFNPLEVALEFSSVRLSTKGVEFETIASQVVVPPTSFQTLTLTGNPKDTGNLIIRGVLMRLNGCDEKEFVMCQVDDDNEKKWIARQADQDDRRTRLKSLGLEARMSIQIQPQEEATGKKAKYALEHFVQCRVVLDQPLLQVESSSLSDGRLQVYEGEKAELCLTLRNDSSLPVDYGKFSFSDNLSLAAQAALSEGGLHASTVHSLEWGLIHQPVLSRDGAPREFMVPASESVPIYIKVLGKPGCSSATIELDYGHTNGKGRGGLATDEKTNFFTRKLSLQIPMDVVKVVQPQAFHIRHLQVNDLGMLMAGSGGTVPSTAEETSVLGEALVRAADESSEQQVCLVSMDVRNVHAHEIELDLRYRRDGAEGDISFKRFATSGSTVRLALPFDQISLSREEESKPIPSLSSRQFTVAREQLTDAEVQQARLQFWYKEHVYQRLYCVWTDVRTGQTGTISMRGQEFTNAQIEMLKRPPLSLVLRLSDDSTPARERESAYDTDIKDVKAHDFIGVTAKITNRSGGPLKLLYRLTPLSSASLDPNGPALAPEAQTLDGLVHPSDSVLSQVLLASGTLSAPVHPWPLLDGASAEVEKSVCFLGDGNYAFVAAIEEAPRYASQAPQIAQPQNAPAANKPVDRIACVSRNRLELRVYS